MPPRSTTRRQFLHAAGGLALWARPLLSAVFAGDAVPWLDEVQRRPETLPDAAPRLSNLLEDAAGEPIATLPAWKTRRRDLRDAWLDLLGPLSRAKREVPTPELLEEDRAEGDVLRQLVRYESEGSEPVEAYVLRPVDRDGARPGVVVFHSTVDHSIRQPAGVEGRPSKAFGLAAARRGCIALCPRNFLWPETGRIDARGQTRRFRMRHPGSTGMARMLYDAQLAVDILAARDDVDSARIGAVGHSLGAKEVLYLAAFDERIRAAVSSEGGIGTTFSNWDAPWYLGDTLEGDASLRPRREHHEVLALTAPRAFLLVGGDSADGARSWPFVEAALDVYRLYGGPPRVGLFNHGKGHAVPEEAERRIHEWLMTYV